MTPPGLFCGDCWRMSILYFGWSGAIVRRLRAGRRHG